MTELDVVFSWMPSFGDALIKAGSKVRNGDKELMVVSVGDGEVQAIDQSNILAEISTYNLQELKVIDSYHYTLPLLHEAEFLGHLLTTTKSDKTGWDQRKDRYILQGI